MDDVRNLIVIVAGGTLAAVVLAHGVVPTIATGISKVVNWSLTNAQTMQAKAPKK